MPFPKLTALQSRLVASVVATALVLILYFALSSTHFAYASEVDSILPEDHNHERLLGPYILEGEADGEDDEIVGYQPDFLGVDRGIIGRADPGTDAVNNNMPVNMNIELGTTKLFVFTNASLWGEMAGPTEGLPSAGLVRREEVHDKDDEEAETTSHISHYEDGGEGLRLRPRADTRKVYITINTCLQPAAVNDQARGMPPPQVTLYVSQNNAKPGPDQPANSYTKVIADHGFANITLDASKDVYIGVAAPNTTSYSGVYNVEVAASIDAPYHSLSTQNGPDLFFIDSDSSSALLVTADLADEINGTIADKWMSLDPPYVIFANNQNDSAFSGIQNSYCGLEKIAQIAGTQGGVRTNMVQTSMTNRTTSSFPKQQFYFRGLNASSEYFGILAMSGNSTAHGSGVVGGGGRVWPTMTFTTQPDGGNCVLLSNLPFCDFVSYAVPGNPNTFPDVNDLAKWYDDTAKSAYDNFNKALAQIPCEIANTGQYSMARTCADCAHAYKNWVCSVTIPRCMDYTTTKPWLQERNVAQPFPNKTMLADSFVTSVQNILYLNSSRNPKIDTEIQPGPYKEILPCEDLCYDLVQSCPAVMGFACPRPGGIGFASSYGRRPNGSAEQDGQITCSYPGAAYHYNAAGMVGPCVWVVLMGVALWGFVLF